MIQNINVKNIYAHPNNPRKDLGDLTELAASIKTSGILQNLTVVPSDAEGYRYTIIIGHRRFAAAKLAGLTEVPCAIANMDEKQQLATMLLENMQRSDLTTYEQAQGFQMMMNLGESVSDISAKTGFSETTVRKRVNLLKLDGTKFKAAEARGARLQDYIELDKIEDSELKNSVLDKIGTSNFEYALKSAIDKEKTEKNRTALIAELETFAVRVDNRDGLMYNQGFCSPYSMRAYSRPDDAGTEKYYFTVSQYSIGLYKERTQTDTSVNTEADKAQQELRERRARLAEISARAYHLRIDFVREFTSAKKHSVDISEFAVKMLLEGYVRVSDDIITEMLDIHLDSRENLQFEHISDAFADSPERILLMAIYSAADASHHKYYDSFLHHCENEELDTVYDFLVKLGYQMSDDELALREGTHELLTRNEDETDDNA